MAAALELLRQPTFWRAASGVVAGGVLLYLRLRTSGSRGIPSLAPHTGRKPTLISINVGNNPARVRFLIYLKGLEQEIDIKTPADFGGVSSDEYGRLNPQRKIPALILEDGSTIFESRVICSYICDRWAWNGPSLRAATAEQRALVNMIIAVHDVYIASPNSSDPNVTATQGSCDPTKDSAFSFTLASSPTSGCMYKSVELIDAEARAAKVAELAKQLAVIDSMIMLPYCAGETLTVADTTLYPTSLMVTFMMPRVFGWEPCLPPKLTTWRERVERLPEAARVRAEVMTGLEGWEKSGRFEPIKAQVQAAPHLQWRFDL